MKQTFFKNITSKLILTIIVIYILISGVLAFFSSYEAKNLASKNAEDFILTSTQSFTNGLNNKIQQTARLCDEFSNEVRTMIASNSFDTSSVKILSRTYMLANNDISVLTIIFDKKLENVELQSFVSYVSNNDFVFNDITEVNNNYTSCKWFRTAQDFKKTVWSKPYHSEFIPDRSLVTTYSIPICVINKNTNKEECIGVIAASVKMSVLENILDVYRIGNNSYNIMIAEDGTFVSHPLRKYVMNGSIFDTTYTKTNNLTKNIFDKLVKGDTNFVTVEAIGNFYCGKSTLLFQNIAANNWKIFVVFPNGILSTSTDEVQYLILAFWILTIIMFSVIIIYFIKLKLYPLETIVYVLNNNTISKDYKKLPNISTNDEFEYLTNHFNLMIETSKNTQHKLSDLDAKYNDLRKHQEFFEQHLEEVVEEKTMELQSQNKLLDMTLNNFASLNELGKMITSTLSLSQISTSIFNKLQRLIPVKFFGVFIYNEKENILECNYPITSSGENETILIPIVETNSFAVKSFELKEPIIINNLDLEYQKYFLNRSNKFIPEDIKSLYYCPIIDNDNVIGIFTIRSSQQGIFRDFNFDILNTLRTYLDISIKNILSYENLQKSINELQVTQNKLVRNEKMASLGQLTAGIAHEIKNPLNFVINFSDLSMDLIEDIVDEINNLKETKNIETINEIEELIEDMKLNVTKINEHSKRADNIIKNMLQHSRGDAGEYSLVDINALVSEFTKLSYHGMRASDTEFNVNIIYDLDKSLEKVKVVPHNISRVIINVVSNAFFATSKKAKLLNETSDTTKFSPEVIIKTINNNNNFVIIVRDNGVGISTDNVPKIFTPFFTTKSTGQGTGLGLSISYEIVIEEHHGEITFETKENEFTEFKITIPKNLE